MHRLCLLKLKFKKVVVINKCFLNKCFGQAQIFQVYILLLYQFKKIVFTCLNENKMQKNNEYKSFGCKIKL